MALLQAKPVYVAQNRGHGHDTPRLPAFFFMAVKLQPYNLICKVSSPPLHSCPTPNVYLAVAVNLAPTGLSEQVNERVLQKNQAVNPEH